MRIAICEDIPKDMERLCTMIRKYCADKQLNVEIDCFTSAQALVKQYLPGVYQILFLDVIMDGMDGMKAAGLLREMDAEVAIIIVTISREFAVDSYLVNAAYYILKPVDQASLSLAMGRCHQLIEQHAKAIMVTQSRQVVSVRLRDILYLESQRNDCIIYTRKGDIRTRSRLVSLEPKLGGSPFLRCHRSFIVNLHWVQDMVDRDFILQNGVKIPISRVYLASVQQEFKQYLITDARETNEPNIFAIK